MTGNEVLLGVAMASVVFIAKYTALLVLCLFNRSLHPFRENEYQDDAILFVVLAVFLSFGSIILTRLMVQTRGIVIALLSCLFASIVPITSFVVTPLLFWIRSRHDHPYLSSKLTHLTRAQTGKKFRIVVSKANIVNAYASGVLPFTKVIMVGKPLLEKMEQRVINAIVCHEAGHLEQHHLLKLLIVNLIWMTFSILGFITLQPHLNPNYMALWVGLYHGLVSGGGTYMLMGFVQKKLELEADAWSAKKVGAALMIESLEQLDKITGGQMENWSWNYPKLSERIHALKERS